MRVEQNIVISQWGRDIVKSRYFAITEFIIILSMDRQIGFIFKSPSEFKAQGSDLPFSHKSLVIISHETNR